jgi:hypothetical protein
MEASYNEEELLLRLLVGVVFPVLLLVTLRMARFGLRGWERRWRHPAMAWLAGLFSRGKLTDPEKRARKAIAFLLGLERVLVFALAAILLSVAWFILFPQTRPLAQELVQGILNPILGLAGAVLRGFLLILYSVAVFLGAFLGTRFLSRGTKGRKPGGILALPLYSVPVKVGVWSGASFLFLLPYPGIPRIVAAGLLLAALLLVLFALRPLIEEVAIGAYLQSSLGLTLGDTIKVDGTPYTIKGLKPVHALLEREGEEFHIPYSRIMKSVTSRTGGRADAKP